MTELLTLNDGDRIVTAFAHRANGPGWSNKPIWVIVADRNGRLRQECLQPEQQHVMMHVLYDVSEAAHKAMTSAVSVRTRTKKVKKQVA